MDRRKQILAAVGIVGGIIIIGLIVYFYAAPKPSATIAENCIPITLKDAGNYPRASCGIGSIDLYAPVPLYLTKYTTDYNATSKTLTITVFADKKPRVACIRKITIQGDVRKVVLQQEMNGEMQPYVALDATTCSIRTVGCGG